MKRVVVLLITTVLLLIEGPASAEERVAKTEASPPPLFGLHATLMRGTFAAVPMTRAGALGELRFRKVPIGMSLSLEGGRTDNGLGTHRAALGIDVHTPWPVVSLNAGAHVAYAILVRTTGNDNFMRALGGDIGGFAIGLHAGLEGHLPLGGNMNLVIGARGALDLYDGAVAAMVGPQLGIVF